MAKTTCEDMGGCRSCTDGGHPDFCVNNACDDCGQPGIDTCPFCNKRVCRTCAEREGAFCCDGEGSHELFDDGPISGDGLDGDNDEAIT